MNQWKRDPMRFGQILDFSISVYRKHFLLMLSIAALFYALPNMLYYFSIYATVNGGAVTGTMMSLLYLILYFLAFPLSTAMFLFVVYDIWQGETPNFKLSFQRALQRLGALLGSSVVLFLMIFGISFLIVVIIMGIALGAEEGGMFSVLLIIPLYVLIGFLFIRFGFYIPEVAIERNGLGLKGSWRITAKNFWRLLGIYFVVSLITGGVYIAFSMVSALIFGESSLLAIVLILVAMHLIIPFTLTTYSVVYFDLKVRKEGTDLDEMMEDIESKSGDTDASMQSE